MKMNRVRTLLLTVVAPCLWGTTYVTVTELLAGGRPMFVAAMRVLPAGVLLVALGRLSSSWRPRGCEWRSIVVLGTCNFALFFPLLVGAVYRLPGGVAAAAGGVQPLLVLWFTWLSARRRPKAAEVVLGMVAAVGVGLVVVRPGAQLDPVGVGLALLANVSFAAGVVLTKRFPAPPNRVAATGWQLLAAGAILVPLALLVEGAPPSLGPRSIIGLGYLSVIATGAAFLLWFNGVRALPASVPPLLGLASPITGAVLGWLVLEQSLSPVQLLGFAVTIGAIAYGCLRPRPEGATTASPRRSDADADHRVVDPPVLRRAS